MSLVERVQFRRDELQRTLTASSASPSTRADIETALASVAAMMTGDLAKLPNTVKGDLARWLESSRYLGIKAEARPAAAAVAAVPAVLPKGDEPSGPVVIPPRA